MRTVLDGVTEFCRRMKELGKEEDLNTSMVFETVSSKIESNLFFEFMRQRCDDEEKTVPTLVKFLRQETEARELREHPHTLMKTKSCHLLEQSSGSSFQIATTFSHPPSSSYRQLNQDPCPLCSNTESHLIIRCPVFTSNSPEERRRMIKESRRCFLCFKPGHVAGRCRRPDRRRCQTCRLYHHRLIACPPDVGMENTPPSIKEEKDQAGARSSTGTLNSMSTTKNRFSPTTFVEIKDKYGNWQRVVAFFDSGADTTLIRSSTADRLGLSGDPFVFTFGVAGGGTVKEQSSRYNIDVRSHGGSQIYQLIASSVQKPVHDSPRIDSDVFIKYPHLAVAQHFTPYEGAEIDLLIGYDYHWLTTPLEIIYSTTDPTNHPAAARSLLGWTMFGTSLPKPISDLTSRVTFLRHMDDMQLLFTSDVVGVKPTTLCTCTDKEVAEAQFIKHCRKKLQLNSAGRMVIEMPWKEGFPGLLTCNRAQAEACMIRQEAILAKKGKLAEYDNEIQKLLDNGFVRKLSPEEDKDDGWYMPHHAVYQAHKSTKVRIVWNSAARYKGLCLNDGFLKGPDLLNSLVKCFLHFRKENVAVVGDVKKMFNQIALVPRDQMFHRFVWRLGGSGTINHFQWLRLPFGDKPAPDISMMAVRLLTEASKQSELEGYIRVTDRMYMDDITDSFTDPMSASRAINQVDRILTKGSFTIKEWHSNHRRVDQCPEEQTTRVLGHLWDKSRDTITIQLDQICTNISTLTKRKAASLVAKLWDPLGLLSPVSIRYRIGLQEMWSSGLGWDDILDEGQRNEPTHCL
ncbi:uncharacterized protein LOC117103640 [Anneissia japonica]|uniref:uncharacterized protein LOC117103640 n=1 Tax=Anneissia japonica TaxID=1529436 RepID=UPI00142569B8|nr:uncharacterized protein LOC117103640 [Anneissia japonica]